MNKGNKEMRRLMSILVGIMVVTVSTIAAEWKLHPSFDRTPLRVIDTPENTYFLVHQQIYNKNIIGYDFPSLTLFEYQKKSPEKGIVPLCHSVSLSSADIRMADYSPKGDYLIVVYNDGDIDLIDKNKKLTHIDRLKRYSIPGMTLVNSVTFEASSGDAWIATDAGYMCIDAISFTVKDVKVLGSAITAINRFGTRLVAISNSEAYETDKEGAASLSDFTKIPAITSPTVMMPLSDNCFGYIQGAAGSTRPLMSATLVDGAWKTVQLGSDNFYSQVANESLVSRYEANFIPNKDGYFCFSSSKAWQLKAPAGGEGATVISISLDQDPVSMGSWDFIDFWSYRDRGTFVPQHATYTPSTSTVAATWKDLSAPIRPNAPAAFICTYMSYSPKYGMLAMNHGVDYHFSYTGKVNPNLLSGINNNKWTIYSQSYTVPYSIRNDSELLSKYNEFYPIYSPQGFLIDPLMTSKVWISSMFGGIMVMDMDDLGMDVIRWGTIRDPFVGFPGFIPSMPETDWGSHCAFSPAVLDSDGNLYTLFYARGQSRPLQLKCLKNDRVNNIYNNSIENISTEDVWHTIVLPYTGEVQSKCKVLPLRYPSNKNKFIISPCASWDHPIIIYDTNGTIDNIDDDEYIEIEKVSFKTGETTDFIQINDIVENIETGEVIISSLYNTVSFFLDGKLNGNVIEGELLGHRHGVSHIDLSEVNKLIFDEYGRMWIATNNHGVLGVSACGEKVVAEYNTSNSPIPSDAVYGLCWNEEKRNLLISTKHGIAEVYPDMNSESIESGNITIYPRAVTSDYNGNILISNIGVNSSIAIKDKNGIVIKVLNNAQQRDIEWDMTDNQNKRVKSGYYSVVINGGESIDVNIMRD